MAKRSTLELKMHLKRFKISKVGIRLRLPGSSGGACDVGKIPAQEDLIKNYFVFCEMLIRQKREVLFPLLTDLRFNLLWREVNVIHLVGGENEEQAEPLSVVFVAFADLRQNFCRYGEEVLEIAVCVPHIHVDGSTSGSDVHGEDALGNLSLICPLQDPIHVEDHARLMKFGFRGEPEQPIQKPDWNVN